jgi:hypothetical protein
VRTSGTDFGERDPLERIRSQGPEGLFGAGDARQRTLRDLHRLQQAARRVLERLALEETRDQVVALVPTRELVVEIGIVGAGKQPAGLEIHQRRRDEQELGRAVEIDPLEPGDLGEIAVNDVREADLEEVDLFLQDEVQKQVEGTLEHRGLDLVSHWFHPSRRPNHIRVTRGAGTIPRP